MITNTCPKCQSPLIEFTAGEKTYSRCNTCNELRVVVNGLPTHTILN